MAPARVVPTLNPGAVSVGVCRVRSNRKMPSCFSISSNDLVVTAVERCSVKSSLVIDSRSETAMGYAYTTKMWLQAIVCDAAIFKLISCSSLCVTILVHKVFKTWIGGRPKFGEQNSSSNRLQLVNVNCANQHLIYANFYGGFLSRGLVIRALGGF